MLSLTHTNYYLISLSWNRAAWRVKYRNHHILITLECWCSVPTTIASLDMDSSYCNRRYSMLTQALIFLLAMLSGTTLVLGVVPACVRDATPNTACGGKDTDPEHCWKCNSEAAEVSSKPVH